ncbi:MAG: hypothetical protein HRT92_11740 [Piscirickettsiaceae bacterium]|nr:hypothetical protein [Piscirickettsiaceae bacterium]
MLEKILEKKCDLIVSLEDVKSNLVISEDEDVIDSDELLKTRILIAQSLCEQYTNKPLTKTKYAVRYDLPYNNQDSYLSFSDPGNIFKNIRLPYRPLISVESMTSVRYNGETFPVDVSDYVVDTELDIVYFNNYPTRGEMLKIIFLAGYERVSDVPASYKGAVIKLIEEAYELRDGTVELTEKIINDYLRGERDYYISDSF